MSAPPKLLASVCMAGGIAVDTKPMPEDALVVTSIEGEKVEFTVSQKWVEEAGMAVQSGMDDCIVKDKMILGSTEDFGGVCLDGVASVTIVVYMDASFDPEQCEACNVDDLISMGSEYKLCAYHIEIPCEQIAVKCSEPSSAPSSGSCFPSSAPSDSPTKIASNISQQPVISSQPPFMEPIPPPTNTAPISMPVSMPLSSQQPVVNQPVMQPVLSPPTNTYPVSMPISSPPPVGIIDAPVAASSLPISISTLRPTTSPTESTTTSESSTGTSTTESPTTIVSTTKSSSESPTQIPINIPSSKPSYSPSKSLTKKTKKTKKWKNK